MMFADGSSTARLSSGRRIAICGKQHSGKTALASFLVNDHGFRRIALADALKQMSVDMINFFLQQGGQEPWFTLDDLEKNKQKLRWFLQGVGTDLCRDVLGNTDFWVQLFLNQVADNKGQNIVCDDVRFLNEADALQRAGFFLVKVVRDEDERRRSVARELGIKYPPTTKHDIDALERILSHRSETEVDMITADVCVANLSLDGLKFAADRLAAS